MNAFKCIIAFWGTKNKLFLILSHRISKQFFLFQKLLFLRKIGKVLDSIQCWYKWKKSCFSSLKAALFLRLLDHLRPGWWKDRAIEFNYSSTWGMSRDQRMRGSHFVSVFAQQLLQQIYLFFNARLMEPYWKAGKFQRCIFNYLSGKFK